MAGNKRPPGKGQNKANPSNRKRRPAIRSKAAIVTFKVEDSLMLALQSIRNRSEFIRSAVLAALENSCPLCRGTGILTPEQKKHWERFAVDHTMRECKKCHEWHLVCEHDTSSNPHG